MWDREMGWPRLSSFHYIYISVLVIKFSFRLWNIKCLLCSVLFLIGVEWGLLFPCANGEYQSPINLNSREAQYDPSLLDVGLSPNYVVCRDCEVINDGHTVRIILKSKSGGSVLNNELTRKWLRYSPEGVLLLLTVVTGGPLPSGYEYELHEVRFHWGKENQRGSEHTVNFKAFPMEVVQSHTPKHTLTQEYTGN